MVDAESDLRSSKFRRERQKAWKELEVLVQRVEKRGIRSLDPVQLERLPGLYRSTLSSLAVARSTSLDRNLRDYLEGLTTRAWLCVYGPQEPVGRVFLDIVRERFPRAVRQSARFIGISGLLMGVGWLTGFSLTLRDMEWYYTFMPDGLAGGRGPTSSTESLLDVIYGGGHPGLSAFAAQLFSHNSLVALTCFSSGFLLGIPTALLLFYTGLNLGTFTALHHARGIGSDVWGWLLIHGVTELSAIVLAGGAGLLIGHSLISAGQRPRLDALKERGREAAPLVAGCVLMLFVAALLEGYARELIVSKALRFAIAFLSGSLWLWYFLMAGRKRR